MDARDRLQRQYDDWKGGKIPIKHLRFRGNDTLEDFPVWFFTIEDAKDLWGFSKSSWYKDIYIPIVKSKTWEYQYLTIKVPTVELCKALWITKHEYNTFIKHMDTFMEYIDALKEMKRKKKKKDKLTKYNNQSAWKIGDVKTYKKYMAIAKQQQKIYKQIDSLLWELKKLSNKKGNVVFRQENEWLKSAWWNWMWIKKNRVYTNEWVKLEETLYVQTWGRPKQIKINDNNRQMIELLLKTTWKDERTKLINTIQNIETPWIRQ